MIPEDVNWLGVLDELNRLGLKDGKIELLCDFTAGYIAQIRCGNTKKLGYEKGARLMNLLDEEMKR